MKINKRKKKENIIIRFNTKIINIEKIKKKEEAAQRQMLKYA